MLLSLNFDLTLSYLDDVTLCGPAMVASTVASDVAKIATVRLAPIWAQCSTHLSMSAHPDFSVEDDMFHSFTRVDVSAATLLGMPLFFWACT